MQHTLNCPSFGASDLETNPTFNVVIAYEDFQTGKYAKRTYDFLVENLGRDCQLANQMWKFEVLRIPKLRDLAVKDAAMADIVLVSCHGGSDLPAEVKHWLEAWLQAPGEPLALVALFDRPREHTLPIRSYLASVARRAQTAFFAQPDGWPQHPPGDLLPTLSRRPGLKQGNLFTTLAGVVQQEQPVPRWEGFE
jgi:hypothetical protein